MSKAYRIVIPGVLAGGIVLGYAVRIFDTDTGLPLKSVGTVQESSDSVATSIDDTGVSSHKQDKAIPRPTTVKSKDFVKLLLQALLVQGEKREAGVHKLLQQWLFEDADGAIEWMLSKAGDEGVSEVFYGYIKAHMAKDPDALAGDILVMPSSELKNRLSADYVKHLLQSDTDAAFAWIENIDEEDLRTDLNAQLLSMWLAKEPLDAIKYMSNVTDITDESTQEKLTSSVRRASEDDPNLILGYIDSFPEGMRTEVITIAVQSLSNVDTPSAINWIHGQEEGPRRDAAIQGLVGSGAGEYPADAFELAETMKNNDMRLATLREAFAGWVRFQPAEAMQALEASKQLSRKEKTRLTPEHLKNLSLEEIKETAVFSPRP